MHALLNLAEIRLPSPVTMQKSTNIFRLFTAETTFPRHTKLSVTEISLTAAAAAASFCWARWKHSNRVSVGVGLGFEQALSALLHLHAPPGWENVLSFIKLYLSLSRKIWNGLMRRKLCAFSGLWWQAKVVLGKCCVFICSLSIVLSFF